MTWRDNWLGYVIAVLAIAIFGFVWLDTRSDMEHHQRANTRAQAQP